MKLKPNNKSNIKIYFTFFLLHIKRVTQKSKVRSSCLYDNNPNYNMIIAKYVNDSIYVFIFNLCNHIVNTGFDRIILMQM